MIAPTQDMTAPMVDLTEAELNEARLLDFLAMNADASADDLLHEVMRAVRHGGGVWIDPVAQTQAGCRPASHLYEVTLFGISASGEGVLQAILNWRTVALRLMRARLDDASGQRVRRIRIEVDGPSDAVREIMESGYRPDGAA